jgi:hypothetical protein
MQTCFGKIRVGRTEVSKVPDGKNVKAARDQKYLANAYRVLLTRARQGMVIYIPAGDPLDPTRSPDIYDGIAEYLTHCGLKYLPS